ncbi:hypothetical protein GCK32_005533 [Trichostrongylus colubriformis]|uniref:Tyrosine-protein kinase n=1 Tax=Trichostrongylus colubriformis TaxID=6319 RepID=A0AAN8EWD9_TRICO
MDGVRTREREVVGTSHMPWFHSNVTREATERMLHQRADGTFLIRDSTNFPGDYTLSMAYRGKVEHYRIYQSGGQITCDNEEFFANLTQLVSPIQDVVRHIERGYRMEAPEGCPADVVRIMHDAWALQPQDRPTFGQPVDRHRLPCVGDGDLLKGEIECAFCEECSFGFSFLENTFGRVVCTNFRLRFEPVAKPEDDSLPRFKTFHERWEIPLCSIHSIFYAPVRREPFSFAQGQNNSLSKKKFFPSTTSLSSLEVVSCIRLHLKDFRIATIDLRGSQNGVSLLNQILFFSRPLKIDNIVQSGAELEWRGK